MDEERKPGKTLRHRLGGKFGALLLSVGVTFLIVSFFVSIVLIAFERTKPKWLPVARYV